MHKILDLKCKLTSNLAMVGLKASRGVISSNLTNAKVRVPLAIMALLVMVELRWPGSSPSTLVSGFTAWRKP